MVTRCSMVDVKVLEALLEWTRSNNAVIDVYFQETGYRLRIDRMFRAVDPGGNIVPWARAFGTKKLSDLFDTFKVKQVSLRRADTQQTFRSLEELLKNVHV
ncbi:MAG: hypothetical protein B7L53_07355 [Thermofilum sp. NZ13]|nr:MAG: hypothetical protein B7L53_07355 [Thermofilum sp. NZ13]